MATKTPALTVRQLMAVFGRSHVTIYNWINGGTSTRTKFPERPTATSIQKWAERNEVELRRSVDAVLAMKQERLNALLWPEKYATKPTKRPTAKARLRSATKRTSDKPRARSAYASA